MRRLSVRSSIVWRISTQQSLLLQRGPADRACTATSFLNGRSIASSAVLSRNVGSKGQRQKQDTGTVALSKRSDSMLSRQLEDQLETQQNMDDQISLQRAIAESGEFAPRDGRYETSLDRMKPNPMTAASLASNPPITDPQAVRAIRQELMPSKIKKWEELVELYQKKWQRRRKQERMVRERQEQRTLNMPLRPVRSRRRDVEALVESGAPPELISRTIRARTRISRIESEAVRQLEGMFRSSSAAELRRDPDLFPGGFPPVVADVEVAADARTAIVRWSPPLMDGLMAGGGHAAAAGPVRSAALAAAAAASDAGFTSVREVQGRLALESLTRQESHRLDRSMARVRKAIRAGEVPDQRHIDILSDFGVDWRQLGGGSRSGGEGRGGLEDGEDVLGPGASRMQRALAQQQMHRQARSLGTRKRSTMKRVLDAAEEEAERALMALSPEAAAQASRMEAALERHTGRIQRLLAQRMPLKFAVQIRFKRWLGARPADLLQQAALARRAASDPESWARAKAEQAAGGASKQLLDDGESDDWAIEGGVDGALEAWGGGLSIPGADVALRSNTAVPRAPSSLLRKRVQGGLDALQQARASKKKKGAGLGPRKARTMAQNNSGGRPPFG